MADRRRHLIGLTAGLILAACEGSSQPSVPSAQPSFSVEVPPPTPHRPGSDKLPSWVSKLPSTARSFVAGARVWAVVPRRGSELVELRVYKLKESFKNEATLIDVMGGKHRRVPAALIHPCAPLKRLRAGQQVLFYTWTNPGSIGRITRLQNNAPIRVQYDQTGKTAEIEVDHAEALRSGINPLAQVSFPKGTRRSKGLVVAVDGKRSWVWTASGHVEIHPNSQLKPLQLVSRPQVGTQVLAFTWASGLQRGKVVKATEAGLRYRVQFGPKDSAKDFFFSRLFRPRP